MATSSAVLALLSCAALAYGQDDAEALFQHSVQRSSGPMFGVLTEGRVNTTKWLVKDIFAQHGTLLANMLGGKKDGVVELSRPTGAKCSAADMTTLQKVMLGQATLVSEEHDECNTEALAAPEGFEHEMFGQCLEKSAKITKPCQTCFTDLAKNIIGTPEDKGCNRQCVMWSTWCQDGPKEFCYWFMTECVACAKPHVNSLLECMGTPAQSTFMQAYDDYAAFIMTKSNDTQWMIAHTFVDNYPFALLTTPFIE
eukprot:CAMPEP_0204533098 /NCGR_PEP_ID=MMETSP0661-20131031/12087_1 /ASSEMBLY_ACC=CAM_ASM_000606 /TAXON_ID=109239 /ORGANISM="Alexandrium margalefi, Strain AMGDE01CS-322" /LENGTH=253 /DNA_ID=CAMNT_0051539399 /DNA_START=69 /DNA_END=830 /DNA_ORIENTATION=+